jgi:23S rRNA (adenine2503-C2)-methyltransferase
MTELAGLFPEEMSAWAKEEGLPAFRGKQIFQWIHRGADFDEMTNLPGALRESLKEKAVAQPVRIERFQQKSVATCFQSGIYSFRVIKCSQRDEMSAGKPLFYDLSCFGA